MLAKIYLEVRFFLFRLVSILMAPIFLHYIKISKFENIVYFKRENWHDGFIYFTAKKDGVEYFIKCSWYYKEVQNETFFSEFMNSLKLNNLVIRIKSLHSDFGHIVAMPYLSSSKSFCALSNDEYKLLVDDIITINNSGVLLRDFKPDNIVITDRGIYFIDFTFAQLINGIAFGNIGYIECTSKYILKHLGYICRTGGNSWDDLVALELFLLDSNVDSEVLDYLNDVRSIRDRQERKFD